MKMRLVVLAIVFGVLAFAPAANATPFGVTYNGGLFTIEVIGSSTGTDFTVRYIADLTNFTGDDGQQDFLYGIGFRPSPDGIQSGDVTGAWTFFANELSANGCRNGSNSFACASTWNGTTYEHTALTTVAPLGLGPIYQWDFTLHYASEVTLNLEGVSIKAAFSNDDQGLNSRGLMSLTTTQVPEPTSMLLFGVGLLGLGLLRRHRS